MPINGEIRADKIRLISESGEQLGIVSLNEALAKAEEASLDLVQMAKEGDPLVCRLERIIRIRFFPVLKTTKYFLLINDKLKKFNF